MEINILALLIILGINLLISPFLIYALGRFGFYKQGETTKEIESKRNKKYYKHLLSNMHTPSTFGILLVLNLLIVTLLFKTSGTFKIVSLVAIILGLLGFADDLYEFFYYKKTGRWGFKARYKMFIQILTFFGLAYILTNSLLVSIPLSLIFAFILNSFNITDGLDGLAAGTALPTFAVFTYLEYLNYGTSDIFFLLLLVIGFLVVFLIFNIKPAKVFLGDSGSYALGAILAFLTFRYNIFFTIPLITVFLVEGISSLLQILSLGIFKRRVFKIAPLHLHLLNSGWSQWKVILTSWGTQAIIAILTFLAITYVR
jgi:phospho-N-acetylmuramoyl-pentapeptide-transferase